jgi:hypothetical protein
MGFDVNQLHSEICGSTVLFSYVGDVASGQINSILEEIEGKLSGISSSIKVRKKIYNVMVESLQNLFHHSEDVPEDLVPTLGKRYGMIVVKKENDDLRLTVGNFVTSDQVKFLGEKIEKINTLSKEELKEMYKFILNYQKISSKGGGGLGLIDMARKSNKKLEYKFYSYNENYSFYRLDIFISF